MRGFELLNRYCCKQNMIWMYIFGFLFIFMNIVYTYIRCPVSHSYLSFWLLFVLWYNNDNDDVGSNGLIVPVVLLTYWDTRHLNEHNIRSYISSLKYATELILWLICIQNIVTLSIGLPMLLLSFFIFVQLLAWLG